MSQIISGDQANVTTPLIKTINAVTSSGGLIKIGTSTSHLFATGDIVTIIGVTGTTEANGTWAISVVDATHFTLNGSTFTHSYVSGGTVTDWSLTPQIQLPSNGEPCTMDTLLSALEALADRTQYLAAHARTNSVTFTISPTPFNISYGTNWLIGDDGTGSATGALLVKSSTTDDTAIIVDISPFLIGHDKRTLANVSTVFAVGQSHSAVPAILPSLRIYRTQSLTTLGVAPAALTSLIAAGSAPFPTPVSGSAYYASGALQAWNAVPDQNNVIDTAYRYLLALIDESGSNSHGLNKYYGFRISLL